MPRRHIEVRGIVQGVGFRPFVYNLARGLKLGGFVLNSSRGVAIEVEGNEESLREFADHLRARAPALASIDELMITDVAPGGDRAFEIRASAEEAGQFALVPPDIATCEDCVRDFTDPANRRYRYPFTNCTNCGPRYTIIEDIPYDRPSTTMSEFRMCAECEGEYHNPSDRRFHAQPNACPVCGPWVELWDHERKIAGRDEALDETIRLLRAGSIVAIKGIGGFHLACDAANSEAVRRLRERKRKSDKPFAVMSPDVDAVSTFCAMGESERQALLDPRRPIVILTRRPDAAISDAVAPGNTTIGVMLPYTPLHHLLFAGPAAFQALVMTSGNLSEEPIVSLNEEVAPRLHGLCDHFLIHNRRIRTRVDDSVLRVFERKPRPIRRSRGFAPQPIDLHMPLRQVLAVGGELKSAFCLTRSHYAILSQHIGDLENYETLVFFRETLDHMKRFFRIEPEAVAHDLHPGYLSTKLSLEMEGLRPIGVQHHHAHIASCAAENGVTGRVIGVALDGTGYGTDGKVWGGEFLVADVAGFERRFHFRYVSMIGGDMAVRQPWRMALSYARDSFGRELPDLPAFGGVPSRLLANADRMLEKRVNTIETSSCGRLFDAVASLIGLRNEVSYEGQAAIELEAMAADDQETRYEFSLDDGHVDFRPAMRAIGRDIVDGRSPSMISAAFHNTVTAVILEVCRCLRESDSLERVCLSGGSFQNWRLLKAAVTALRSAGFEVFLHSRVPTNDGGLSLGQAVVANAQLARSGQ